MQEDDHHHHDKADRLENGLQHFVDRLRDEDRSVVNDVVLQPGRELLRHPCHLGLDARGGREGIGAGLLIDEDGHGAGPVEVAVGAVVLAADLHPADVTDAGHAPGSVRLDDDVGELLGVGQAAERLYVELEGAGRGDGRLVEHARGHLDVLRLERGDDLARRQVATGCLVGVEPDAHGVVVIAEDLRVANAFDPRKLVADVQRAVVRHIELIA